MSCSYIFTGNVSVALGPFFQSAVSNDNFGTCLTGTGDLRVVAITAPDDNNGRGAVYIFRDISSVPNILKPSVGISAISENVTVDVSPDGIWLALTAAPNTVFLKNISLYSSMFDVSDIFVEHRMLENGGNTAVFLPDSSTLFLNQQQIRKFGELFDYVWNYQITLDNPDIALAGISATQVMFREGPTNHLHTIENKAVIPSTIWLTTSTMPPPPNYTIWGDVVAIGECGTFGVVHGIVNGLDTVTVIYREFTEDAWIVSDEVYTVDGAGGVVSLSCSQNGGCVVIGAPYATAGGVPNRGRVFILTRNTQTLKLISNIILQPPTALTNVSCEFGTQVLISQDESTTMTVIVTAPKFVGAFQTYIINSN